MSRLRFAGAQGSAVPPLAGCAVHRSEQAPLHRGDRGLRAMHLGARVERSAWIPAESRPQGRQPTTLLPRVRRARLRVPQQGREAGDSRMALCAEVAAVVGSHRGQRPEARPAVDAGQPRPLHRRRALRGGRRLSRLPLGRGLVRGDGSAPDSGLDEGRDRGRRLPSADVATMRGPHPRLRATVRAGARERVVRADCLVGATRRGEGCRATRGRKGGQDRWTTEDGTG